MPEHQEIKIDDSITLRRVIPDDSEVLFALVDRSRPHLSQFGDKTASKYPNIEAVRERNIAQDPNEYRFGIWDKDIFVGFVKVTQRGSQRMEIGYWLGEEFTGRGYMTKAVVSLTSYAKDNLGAEIVYAKVAKGNESSVKVLERVGYRFKGDFPKKPEDDLLEFP